MNQDLLHKYFKGETSVDEEKRILNWVDESEENRKTLQKERMLFDIALFTDSKRKMREKAGAGARIIPMLRWSARIAAAVIVAVSCGFLLMNIGMINCTVADGHCSWPVNGHRLRWRTEPKSG